MVEIALEKVKGFDWDKGNVEKNWRKHKVHFKEAEEIFFDKKFKVFEDIKHSQVEKRFVIYGQTKKRRKLTVIFTLRKDRIRVISARDQNQKERRIYEKKD